MKQNKAHQLILNIPSEAEMIGFGKRLAGACQGNKCVVYLSGELGAGKTTLVRGFLWGLGYEGVVKSPTYTIVEPYEINDIKIYHFDLYRLTNAEELTYIGALDYFAENAIFLIEWAEQGKGVLPPPDLVCQLDILFVDESTVSSRLITISSNSEIGNMVWDKIGENI